MSAGGCGGVESVEDEDYEEEEGDGQGGEKELGTPAPVVGVSCADEGTGEGKYGLHSLLSSFSMLFPMQDLLSAHEK